MLQINKIMGMEVLIKIPGFAGPWCRPAILGTPGG